METLEETLKRNYDWAIHRMDVLCTLGTIEDLEDANSIREEYKEWVNPDTDTEHEILSLQSLSDFYYDGEDVFG